MTQQIEHRRPDIGYWIQHSGCKAFFVVSFLVLTLCVHHSALAQLYPVQATLQITPPYPLSLADYVAPGSERMALNVYLADVNRPELNVRFRLRIEGVGIKIETKQEYLPAPMAIHGGVPLRLIGSDLADYFDPRNLNFSGITQREYEQKAALPEGLYSFIFEVIEYNRGVKVSNSATVTSWLILNDPPLINLPRDNEKIRIQSPQQVVFQWTPRHMGSPNSAFTTEYEFHLVEVWPSTRNPNDAILTSPPIFETTTQGTTLIYGPAETALEPGRRYAYRVKAKSIVGVDELNLFKNNGYSQVSTFVYGDACTLPTGIKAESVGSSRIGVSWDTQENHTGYTINYRLANTPNAVWYTNTTSLNDTEINSLKAGTTYEYQVAATCGFFESAFSPIAKIKTKDAPAVAYACGVPIETFNLDPSALVASLRPGDIIYSGDFDVELTKVTGSNGTFSGEGVVVMPFMNNVKVKVAFTGILISKELRMVQGFMDVKGAVLDIIPDALTARMDQLTAALDDIEEGLDKAEEVVGKIDNILDQAEQIKNELISYLPYAYVQKIKDAQAEMASAKDAFKSAATPEAQATAKTKLKEARAKMKDAVAEALVYYAKLVKEFANIIITSLKELSQEYLGKKDQTESAFNSSSQDLDTYVKTSNNNLSNGQSGVDIELVHLNDESYQLTDSEIESKRNTDADFKTFYDKTYDYMSKLRDHKLTQVIIALAANATKENIESFVGLLKLDGIDILKNIASQVKEQKPEREIIDNTKNQIVQSLNNVMDVIIGK